MIAQKSIFIIPGFQHLPTNNAYKKIATMLQKEGYFPIPITIPWNKATISESTEFFVKEYKKVKTKEKYILGFSFGAMIAFLAATKVNASGLILCSLSPYFKEDVANGKKRLISKITKARYKDFSTLHCSSLAKKIKTKQILMLYGAKETKSLIRRVTETFEQISSTQKYLIPIFETDHDIGDKRYLQKIRQIAKKLK